MGALIVKKTTYVIPKKQPVSQSPSSQASQKVSSVPTLLNETRNLLVPPAPSAPSSRPSQPNNQVRQSIQRSLTTILFKRAIVSQTPADGDTTQFLAKQSILSRGRFGVVANISRSIKDVYLVPLAANESIPSILQPFEGPAIVQKLKRPGSLPLETEEKKLKINMSKDPMWIPKPPVLYGSDKLEIFKPYDPETAGSSSPPGSPPCVGSPSDSSSSGSVNIPSLLNSVKATPSVSSIAATETTSVNNSGKNATPSSSNKTPLQTILKTLFKGKESNPTASSDGNSPKTAESAKKKPLFSKVSGSMVDPIVQQYGQKSKVKKAEKEEEKEDDLDRPYDPEEEYDPSKGYKLFTPHIADNNKTDDSALIGLVEDDVAYDPEDETIFEVFQGDAAVTKPPIPTQSADTPSFPTPVSDSTPTTLKSNRSSVMSKLPTGAVVVSAATLSEQQRMLEELNKQIEEQKRQLKEQEEVLRQQREAVGMFMAHFSVSDTLMSPPTKELPLSQLPTVQGGVIPTESKPVDKPDKVSNNTAVEDNSVVKPETVKLGHTTVSDNVKDTTNTLTEQMGAQENVKECEKYSSAGEIEDSDVAYDPEDESLFDEIQDDVFKGGSTKTSDASSRTEPDRNMAEPEEVDHNRIDAGGAQTVGMGPRYCWRPCNESTGPDYEGPVPDRQNPRGPSFREPMPVRPCPDSDRGGRNFRPSRLMRRNIRRPGPNVRGSAPSRRGGAFEGKWSERRGPRFEELDRGGSSGDIWDKSGDGSLETFQDCPDEQGEEPQMHDDYSEWRDTQDSENVQCSVSGDDWDRPACGGPGPVQDNADIECPGPNREGEKLDWKDHNRAGSGVFFRGRGNRGPCNRGQNWGRVRGRGRGSAMQRQINMENDWGQQDFKGDIGGHDDGMPWAQRGGFNLKNSIPNRRHFEMEAPGGPDLRCPEPGYRNLNDEGPESDGRVLNFGESGSERHSVDMDDHGTGAQGFGHEFRRVRRGPIMRQGPSNAEIRGVSPSVYKSLHASSTSSGHTSDFVGLIWSQGTCGTQGQGLTVGSEFDLTEMSDVECSHFQQFIQMQMEPGLSDTPNASPPPAALVVQDASCSTWISPRTSSQAIDLTTSTSNDYHSLVMPGEKTPVFYGEVPSFVLARIGGEESPIKAAMKEGASSKNRARVCLEKRFNSMCPETTRQQDSCSAVVSKLVSVL
ncbi:hypothetical protein GOODEAATRI_001412 [Goodea atripinnis]|uniref:Uncharacterized protein n=1 Tax=Goodea atripinnis TaxID=208336 RepID=A0ABV0PAF9_9TELE